MPAGGSPEEGLKMLVAMVVGAVVFVAIGLVGLGFAIGAVVL